MRTTKSRQSVIQDNRLAPFSSRNELPIIQQGDNLLIDARLLHQQLKVGRDFSSWIKIRIEEFGFEPDKDFFSWIDSSKRGNQKGRGGDRRSIDVHLTLDMAKELAMVERNDTGRAIRRYFIQKEKEARRLPAGFDPLAGHKAEDFKRGLKPFKINNQTLYPYREVLRNIGYSTLASSSGRRALYGQHFLKVGTMLYITEMFARHLAHSRSVYLNRVKMKETQPLLPLNFGDASALTMPKL